MVKNHQGAAMVRFRFSLVLLASLAFCTAFEQSLSEDFRIDNVVFVGDEKKPSGESTTIFQGGLVYDCMKSPAETVVFDKATDRFVLLNLKRQTRTELSTSQLTPFVERLQTLAAKSNEPVVKFLAQPKFDEETNELVGLVTLSSPLVTYRIVLSPQKSPGVVEQYREFCDHYAKLNTILLPGSLPPFGRLKVDAVLAQHQATASSVTLNLTTGRAAKQQKTTIRSEHRLVCPLETSDLERTAKTRELMESLKLVSFEEYQKSVKR
jgi:hypothetical protein